MYITYEQPFVGCVFTASQMYDVYINLVDKEEYPDFDCWITDMVNSGVFESI